MDGEKIITLKPEITPSMQLHEIMDVCFHEEAGDYSLTLQEHEILGRALVEQTDQICFDRDAVEDEIARQRRYAKEHSSLAKALEDRLESLDNYVSKFMSHGKFQKLTGEKRQITLRLSERLIEPIKPPTKEDAEHTPEFVRVKLEWDKVAIKKALNDGTYPLTNARIEERLNPQFGPKRGR